MLKRTMILLGLTITVGALLLVVGCGGHSNTVPFGSDNQNLLSRQENQLPTPVPLAFGVRSDGRLRFTMKAKDPEGDPVYFKLKLWKNGQLYEFDQIQNPNGWTTYRASDGTVYASFITPNPMGSGAYQWQILATDHNPPQQWAESTIRSTIVG
ncbi:hypothetical protein GG496_000488 [Candidatus Fervidibacteria bacterium JGI MDM2 JNZ-1-D12]